MHTVEPEVMSKHALCGIALILVGLSVGLTGKYTTVYAGDENQSDFLRTYDPMAVVDRYEPHAVHVGRPRSAAAGSVLPWAYCDVSHAAGFRISFDWARESHEAMLNELYHDVYASLMGYGAKVTVQQEFPGSIHALTYQIGRSHGEIYLSLPLRETVESRVTVLLDISEKWSVRSESGG